MSDRIKLLPDSVANQIAAGEVVNRPASVVKELMENAVDAGATNITVNFRDGGRELIQIKDDGCGMSPQDARLAFERHATSKIAAVDDIYKLMTFGFRGEALASIAAVAQVELVSRQESAELGTQLNIDGGSFAGQSATAAPKGTQIWIRNLFYNVPARKKFLDKASTESAHVLTEFQRVVLAHPEVAFQLYRDDAPVYNLPVGSLHRRVVDVAGKGSAAKFLEMAVETSIIKVGGFIGRPASARRRNKEQFLFVNGRFFKSPFFHKAIVQAYEKLIPATVQPSYFVYLEIDPEQIDVNVHPQKTEVKFEGQSAVWQIINAAVRETLAKSGAVPMMDFDPDDRIDIPVLDGHAGRGVGSVAGSVDDYIPPAKEPAVVRSKDYNPFVKYLDDDTASGVSAVYDHSQFEYISSAAEVRQTGFAEFTEPAGFSNAVNIGDGYAAAMWGEKFVVIDLRRAREAVLFDGFVKMLYSGHSATQQLLFPERMVFSADDVELLKDHAEEFAALGFDIRLSGQHAVEIFGTPAEIAPDSLDEVVYEMLDTLRDDVFPAADPAVNPTAAENTRRNSLAAAMARKGAGTSTAMARLSSAEIEHLLASLAGAENHSYTPSGKPVMAEIKTEEIRNRLK